MDETGEAPETKKASEPKWKTDKDGRLIVPLEYPIAGFAALAMRRLKVKDIRTANAQAEDDLEMIVRLACASSGMTLVQIDELDAVDLRQLTEVVTFLQKKSPK